PQRIIGRLVVLRIANHQMLHLHSAISPYLSGGNCNISVNLHTDCASCTGWKSEGGVLLCS
ncbi:hypothetical protein DAH34_25560, partial [Escherichia coli]